MSEMLDELFIEGMDHGELEPEDIKPKKPRKPRKPKVLKQTEGVELVKELEKPKRTRKPKEPKPEPETAPAVVELLKAAEAELEATENVPYTDSVTGQDHIECWKDGHLHARVPYDHFEHWCQNMKIHDVRSALGIVGRPWVHYDGWTFLHFEA